MAGILDLPSELLYIIIDHALTTPVNSLASGIRYRASLARGVYCFPDPKVKKKTTPMSLLLTSRRLSLETKVYLSKSNKSQTLEMDIAIVNDHWIWPTARQLLVWKHDTVLDKFEIDLLPCCTEDERHLQTGGYPYEAASSLVTLLYEFLKNKQANSCTEDATHDCLAHPSLKKPTKISDVTRINTLIIRINTTCYGDGNRLLSGTEVPHRKIQGLAHLDFNLLYSVDPKKAERYLDAIKDQIDARLRSSSLNTASMRVRKILFCIDQAVWKEVSLTG
ncbi:hypothetical protein GMOD_00000620 [Pyrenophora seminiperda CCB06]|uniref:Uncharacterized protein n=1 Tax=Pyrenophora seminiperda CCB06 TaxID=1302712 RepID=A0A3M7M7Q5_9PLEO|nr:hypothetical protein GMOD_00000620 [Pyrenophora seminiperda CCB06]